jgi:hypothetical protein
VQGTSIWLVCRWCDDHLSVPSGSGAFEYAAGQSNACLTSWKRTAELGCTSAAVNLHVAEGESAIPLLQTLVGGPLFYVDEATRSHALSSEFVAWVQRAVAASNHRHLALAVCMQMSRSISTKMKTFLTNTPLTCIDSVELRLEAIKACSPGLDSFSRTPGLSHARLSACIGCFGFVEANRIVE